MSGKPFATQKGFVDVIADWLLFEGPAAEIYIQDLVVNPLHLVRQFCVDNCEMSTAKDCWPGELLKRLQSLRSGCEEGCGTDSLTAGAGAKYNPETCTKRMEPSESVSIPWAASSIRRRLSL
jgi:hypothetical protein